MERGYMEQGGARNSEERRSQGGIRGAEDEYE